MYCSAGRSSQSGISIPREDMSVHSLIQVSFWISSHGPTVGRTSFLLPSQSPTKCRQRKGNIFCEQRRLELVSCSISMASATAASFNSETRTGSWKSEEFKILENASKQIPLEYNLGNSH